jgi:tetratricopeptide (TPR) repeat protein
MHEFRALCLFALKDYQQCAAALYAVLSVGPGWDWTTVIGLYPSVVVYERQLRTLEEYRREHPDAADARFVLAYQYMLGGHNESAAKELREVVKLQPDDQLSAQLLKGLTASSDDASSSEQTPTKSAVPATLANVTGNWKASRRDGATFALTLTKDNKFTWRFAQKDHKQEFGGTFTLADNYLILKASQQNTLIGQVSMEGANKMRFTLTGDNPDDPGLLFTK